MKNQALFSSKDKSKKLKWRLLQFLFGALSVKGVLINTFSSFTLFQKRKVHLSDANSVEPDQTLHVCGVWSGPTLFTSVLFMRRYPAGTCQNDVVLTSVRRHYVVSTAIQHHIIVMCLQGRLYGWIICDLTSFSTVFQSYQDDRWMIMKRCVQWKPVYGWKDFFFKRVSNQGPLDQQASSLPTELPGLLRC